ncbi:hypothetical protein C2E23DRAFT_23688 [Lenzites betulinus]|nr:hypothetical protein C2E23DRAFT_23688 [Lenzites betulinus]
MRFSIAALALTFFSQSIATPMTSRTTTIGASLPVVDLGLPSVQESSITLTQSTVQPNTILPHPDEINIVLLICQSLDCEVCDLINLMGLNADTCFATAHSFVSTAVVQPNAPTLPFNTSVGTTQCGQLIELPDTNTCFNLQGPQPFDSFALLV